MMQKTRFLFPRREKGAMRTPTRQLGYLSGMRGLMRSSLIGRNPTYVMLPASRAGDGWGWGVMVGIGTRRYVTVRNVL